MTTSRPAGPDGLLVVDKPQGLTSHDVVARVRRLAGTRKVGHAGTLDPMATGVLVLGLGRATRLLGHLALGTKTYAATIRLGLTTVTDDAEGDVVEIADGEDVDRITRADVQAAIAPLTGDIAQVPSTVSAIKVDGKRSYARVRDGEDVVLAAREVTVSRFEIDAFRQGEGVLDVDVTVDCSSGTYIRALARDLGASLGVGGHLTALRRTRVGPFGLDRARTLEQLGESFSFIGLDDAVGVSFPRLDLDAAAAAELGHGRCPAAPATAGAGLLGAFGPDGVVALVERRTQGGAEVLRPVVVFAPAAT